MDLTGVSGMLPDLGPITQDLEFEPTRENSSVLQLKSSSSRQNVVFYYKEFYNTFETAKKKAEAIAKGDHKPVAPVYIRKEMVRIVTPGDRSVYDGIAEEDHKRNYFRQYAAFRNGKNPSMGTSLKDMEFINSSELIELNYLGVYSVEQLADSSDSLCERLPRGYEMRTACKIWVEVNTGQNVLASTKKLSADLNAAQELIVKLSNEAETRKKEHEELKLLVQSIQNSEDDTPRKKRRSEANLEEI